MRIRVTKRDSTLREALRGQLLKRLGLGLVGVSTLVVVVAFLFPEMTCAALAAPDPTITVRVYDYTQALPGVLARAEREAGQILAKAGLKVVWSDCWPLLPTNVLQKPCEEERLEATSIRLRVLPTPVGDRLRDTVFGFAIHPALASVYYESAVRFAKNDEKEFEVPPILGCLIAHEIGHLLLGSGSHSFSGVMRSPWDREQLREAMMGALLFTPKQARLMQAELQKRSASEMADAKARPD
jgi:hypothetical protein